MARVVKQRRPPIVAISFAFLFLVASGLAIMFYNKKEEFRIEVISVKERIEEKEDDIDSLQEQILQLTELILGNPGSVSAAQTQTEDVRQELQYEGGLLNALEFWHTQAQDLDGQLKKQIEETKLARKDQQSAVEDKEKLATGQATDLDAFQAKISDVEKKRAAEKTMADENLTKETQAHSEELAKRTGEIDKLTGNLDETTKVIKTKDDKIRDQKAKLAELRNKLTPNIEVKSLGDGSVVYVPPSSDICYIDLGRGAGVQEGLTFTVYPKDGIQQNDKRGSIEVTDVRDTFSVCKVTSGTVKLTDKVANLAFDKTRKFKFVIVGEFDLTFSGVPSAAGRVEVKEAIRLFGGLIDDTLSIQTDFLVVGQQPIKPTPPRDDATDASKQAYANKLAEFNNWQKFQDMAKELNVKRINPRQFMTFTGYVPKKKPE